MSFLETVSRLAGKAAFKINYNSPAILTGVAVAGVVTTAVLAVQGYKKSHSVVDEHQEAAQEVRDYSSEEDLPKNLSKVYFSTGLKLVSAYLPAALSGAATISCIIGSNRISTKRYVAMTAAYKGLEQTFENYKERVREEIGEDQARAIGEARSVEVETIDEKTGEKTKSTRLLAGSGSQYSRVFGRENINWDRTFDLNDLFLRSQQSYANDLLRINGHLVLNDVYRRLGFDATPEGYVVGWVYQGEGDGFVDFGLDKGLEMAYDGSDVALDFNVDGFINDKI